MPGQPDFERRSADWLEVDAARVRILANARTTPAERVPILDALGQALAEDVFATATLPPWDNSAMDGYSVRAKDVAGASAARPVRLAVLATLRAGDLPGRRVGPGEAVRIMTGAPLPPGADSVIRVEDTDREAEAGVIAVLDDRDAGRNVRPGGADMKPGDRVLQAGSSVHAGTVGVLAALGIDRVAVHGRPKVAILTTGDELRASDRYDDVKSGKGIPESNGPMLAAAVASAGGVPVALGTAPDHAGALADALARGGEADLLVTVGGASMGEADLVKKVLEAHGFRLDFWRVKVRPGSPFGFGWLPRPWGDQPVFSLPGNPASAFVTFELFVRPFLLATAGHRHVLRRTIRCVAGEDFTTQAGLTLYLRVALEGGHPPVAVPTGPQGSGLVRSLAAADGLAVVPEAAGRVRAGESIDVLLLDVGPGLEELGPPRSQA